MPVVLATPSLEDLLVEILGQDRRGGPTPYGWHRWNDLLQCPRKYDILYNRDAQPDVHSNALEFGGLLHECLAIYYEETRGFLFEVDNTRANQLYDEYCAEPQWQRLLGTIEIRGGEDFLDLVADVRRVMDAYVAFYPMLQDSFLKHEIVAIEEYIATTGPFDFTTRADLVYRSEAGLWMVDHKTSRMMTEDLASGWSINGQMLGLVYAAQQRWPNETIRGLVINIIVRTKIPQLRRVTVPLRTDLVALWLSHMQTWDGLKDAYARLGWPPNYASCIHRYGRCAFYGDCESGQEGAIGAVDEIAEDLTDAVDDPTSIWEP